MLLPVVLFLRAKAPVAELSSPVVLEVRAEAPIAVLPAPVVTELKALVPYELLLAPSEPRAMIPPGATGATAPKLD